jgi:hypothetical protein
MQPVVFAQSVTFLAQFISKHERYSYHFGFLTGDISRKEFYAETLDISPERCDGAGMKLQISPKPIRGGVVRII